MRWPVSGQLDTYHSRFGRGNHNWGNAPNLGWAIVVQAFNPSTWEAVAGDSLQVQSAWCLQAVSKIQKRQRQGMPPPDWPVGKPHFPEWSDEGGAAHCGGATSGRRGLGSITKQGKQATENKPVNSTAPLHDLCVSSDLQAPALFRVYPELPQW